MRCKSGQNGAHDKTARFELHSVMQLDAGISVTGFVGSKFSIQSNITGWPTRFGKHIMINLLPAAFTTSYRRRATRASAGASRS